MFHKLSLLAINYKSISAFYRLSFGYGDACRAYLSGVVKLAMKGDITDTLRSLMPLTRVSGVSDCDATLSVLY